MNLAEAHQHGCLTSFANLLARRGDHKRALPLLLICINHTSTAAETKARAGKLAGELKEKMTLAEIESARIFPRPARLKRLQGIFWKPSADLNLRVWDAQKTTELLHFLTDGGSNLSR